MKHFINLKDVSSVSDLVKEGLAQKANPFANKHLGLNKTIGLLFFNSSLRTRISTQKAALNSWHERDCDECGLRFMAAGV